LTLWPSCFTGNVLPPLLLLLRRQWLCLLLSLLLLLLLRRQWLCLLLLLSLLLMVVWLHLFGMQSVCLGVR